MSLETMATWLSSTRERRSQEDRRNWRTFMDVLAILAKGKRFRYLIIEYTQEYQDDC